MMSRWKVERELLIRAVFWFAVFVALHLAGLRKDTSVLCGMMPETGPHAKCASYLGLIYIISYLGAVVVSPILVIAAGLHALIFNKRHTENRSE